MTFSPSDIELTSLLEEALSNAKAATSLDESHNLPAAVESYDKAILYLDEVLVKISRDTALWSKLVQLRDDYDDRMEFLRLAFDSATRSSPAVKASSVTTNRKKRQSQVNFEEDPDLTDMTFIEGDSMPTGYEEPPRSLIQVPYYQMRTIQKSIESGAFLTPTLFCPKTVWAQIGVKFSGISIKTSAFQDVVSIVRLHVPSLPDDSSSPKPSLVCGRVLPDISLLQSLLTELRLAHEEMIVLQNHLSKPYPFIREVVQQPDSISKHASSKGIARFTGMVTALGKSVVTMAETQYQRLGTIATHVTDDDFVAYVALVAHLCEVCQKLDEWRRFIEIEIKLLRPVASRSDDEDGDSSSSEGSNSHSNSHSNTSRPGTTTAGDDTADEGAAATAALAAAERLDLLQDVHVSFSMIAVFMRDVVCEILLQDAEALTLRYIQKSRKNFSSNFWDDDGVSPGDYE